MTTTAPSAAQAKAQTPGLPLAVRALLAIYGLAWRAVLPGLKRNKRLQEGWEQRTLAAALPEKADLWIQAASGGEAYLTWELLRRLPEKLSCAARPRVLATTFTSQGLGVLTQAREALADAVDLVPAYFPFDLPGNMDRVLASVCPKAVVLLETEIWPGILAACRTGGVPALVLNGRMTHKSLRGYLRAPWLWRPLSPTRVLAVSDDDAGRFATLFPQARVGVMHNIKFDRLNFSPAPPSAEIAAFLPPQQDQAPPFIVLGSVRKEEEEETLLIVQGILERCPEAVIGLFPRHMQRIEAWTKLLSEAKTPYALRSAGKQAQPGSVLLWDAFGELSAAFGLAQACFVGGSLANLGGQNFLEPLAFGVVPVIGPSWSNFAWVGEEIFATGTVRQASGWQGVLDELCALAVDPPDRALVRAAAAVYAAQHRGGAEAACLAVAECLNCG